MEKPSTKIIVTVVGGLLLAAALYICRVWLPPLFKLVWGFVVSVWGWLTSTHNIYGWVIVLFSIVFLWSVIRFIAKLASGKSGMFEPTWRDFTELKHLDVVWRWNYGSSGDIFGLYTFCPLNDCDMQIWADESAGRAIHHPEIVFRCDRCGYFIPHIDGTLDEVESKVKREIQRLLRNDQWKAHIKLAEQVEDTKPDNAAS